MSAQTAMRVKCKGAVCKKEIIWAEIEGGGKVPLDPVAAVYMLAPNGRAVRALGYHVNHFSTCPDANDFNRKAREAQGDLLSADQKTQLEELAGTIERGEASLTLAMGLAEKEGHPPGSMRIDEDTARKCWAAEIRKIIQGGT